MEDDSKEENDSNVTDNNKTMNEGNSSTILLNSVKKKVKSYQYYGTGKLPCPDLGPGWYFEQVIRQQGKSAGQYDTYYHSPSNVKVRSKLKLQELVTTDLRNFDFNAGKFVEDDNRCSNKQRRKQSSLHHAHLKTVGSTPKRPYVTISNGKIKISGLLRSGYFSRHDAKRLKRKGKGSLNKVSGQVNTENAHDMEVDDISVGICSPENSAATTCFENSFNSSLVSVTDCNSPGTSFSADVVLKQETSSMVLSPYELFKEEALPQATEIIDNPDQIESLILCAWSYLSVDNKLEFEHIAISNGYQDPNSAARSTVQMSDIHQDTVMATHEFQNKKSTSNVNSEDHRNIGFISQRRKACGICQECQAENCGICGNCKDLKKFRVSGCQKKSCIWRKCKENYSIDTSFSTKFHSTFTTESSEPIVSKQSLVWQSGEKEDLFTNYHISDSSGSNAEFPLDGMLDEVNSEMNSSHSDAEPSKSSSHAEPSNSSSHSGCISLSNPKINNLVQKNQCIPNLKQEHGLQNVPSSFFLQDCPTNFQPTSFPNEEKPNKRKSRLPICIKQTLTSRGAENDIFFVKEEAS